MNKLLEFKKQRGLTEFQWDIIDYTRAILGTIHLTLAISTGSLTLGLF